MSKVKLKVDRVVNTISTIDQNHMSPDDKVTVAARGMAETACHRVGCRTAHSPHIRIEHIARPKAIFVE